MVSFRIPPALGGRSSSTGVGADDSEPAAEIIGPFRILALGNRKGSIDTARIIGQRPSSENDIAVSVEIRGADVEPKAQRILNIVSMTNFKGVQVLLHPATDGK